MFVITQASLRLEAKTKLRKDRAQFFTFLYIFLVSSVLTALFVATVDVAFEGFKLSVEQFNSLFYD